MVIVKNLTAIDISIEDLGIIIPGSSVVTLTETFGLHEIVKSIDLKTQVNNNLVIINDGNLDLNKEDSIKNITYETVYDDKTKLDRIIDLAESQTYLTTWSEKLKLDLTDLETSKYLLNWSFEIISNDKTPDNRCDARVVMNDSNVIAVNTWPFNKYQYFDGADIAELTGNLSISIQYKRGGNYQPVYIRNVKISLIKLD